MNNYRQIVSIALLITSVVLILTGGLILLHLDSRTVMHLHKYFGVAFMVAALLHMGINTEGGTFCYPEPKETDAGTKISILTQLKKNFNIPIDDDYLYEEFGIDKPAN